LTILDTDNVELRFIGFGHEESGLRGANQYVARMPAEERARVKGVFNMDMTGSADFDRAKYWCMMTVDGLPNLVTETFIAAGERLGYGHHIERGQFSSSDHVPFHNAGMPAAMGMCFNRPEGYTGMITPQNYTIEAAYHTPLDTMEDNVSVERMQICIEVVTAAIYDLAQNYVEPFGARAFAAPASLSFDDAFMYILTGEYQDALMAAATE
jgi:aminopeptidase YwaD